MLKSVILHSVTFSNPVTDLSLIDVLAWKRWMIGPCGNTAKTFMSSELLHQEVRNCFLLKQSRLIQSSLSVCSGIVPQNDKLFVLFPGIFSNQELLQNKRLIETEITLWTDGLKKLMLRFWLSDFQVSSFSIFCRQMDCTWSWLKTSLRRKEITQEFAGQELQIYVNQKLHIKYVLLACYNGKP